MPALFPLSVFHISIKLLFQLSMPTASNQNIPEAFPSFLYKAFPFLCLPLNLYQKQIRSQTLAVATLNKEPLFSFGGFCLFPQNK